MMDFHKQEIKVECSILKYIGFYGIILFYASLASNLIYIWTYVKTKQLHSTCNVLLLSLSVLCLIGTICELPLATFSAFGCK